MARKPNYFETLVSIPWWAGLIVAVVVYFGLDSWIPAYLSDNPVAVGLVMVSKSFAPYGAGLCVLAAIISALVDFQRGELLESQTSIKSIQDLSWREFENLLSEAFKRKGYTVYENPTAGPDGGIDLTLHKDQKQTLVQCKNWRTQQVGVKVVRELLGVMTVKKADAGIIVCSGSYTKEAIAFARQCNIELIGENKLTRLINSVQKAQQVKIEPEPKSISCPKCSGTMVLRTANKGMSAGSNFYGCCSFPKCKGTRNL